MRLRLNESGAEVAVGAVVSGISGIKERSRTILVVDDEALVRLAISGWLEDNGFDVLEAGTADEALISIETNGTVIDLVFSDIHMPGSMDGCGLAKWIYDNRSNLPVILTSTDAGKLAAAKDLCVDEMFVYKPYDVIAVVTKIRKVIDAGKKLA